MSSDYSSDDYETSSDDEAFLEEIAVSARLCQVFFVYYLRDEQSGGDRVVAMFGLSV